MKSEKIRHEDTKDTKDTKKSEVPSAKDQFEVAVAPYCLLFFVSFVSSW